MADAFMKVLEDSVVAGGFLLLLYYFINEQKTILREFAQELRKSNEALMQISERLQVLETKDRKED